MSRSAAEMKRTQQRAREATTRPVPPLTQVAPAVVVLEPAEPYYVCGPKPMRQGERTLREGDRVYGAETWTRLESWVRSGRIVLKEPS